MQGFKITDPVDNAVKREYFNLRVGRAELCLLYKGVQYSRFPERLMRLLNNANMEFGLNDNGEWFAIYPKDAGFEIISDPDNYGKFAAKLTEGRWRF